MKKDVTGVAGAARVDQLSMGELTHAERHGKRLDKTSKSRAISKDPPVTTTGLDLNMLYHAHVAGAFIPKCRAREMQVIVQFPKDLVDGEDAALMLRHARAFVEGVFGPDSIFADRVDRDEKSRHVVDLFIAPKYVKTTKHQEKVAVTMSRHQKELARQYNCPPTPVGTGRALQDALFDYLRSQMGLNGVKRGEPKMIPGPDWKLPEQLREEELAHLKAETERARADAKRERAKAIAARAAMEATFDRFEAEHEEAIAAAIAREQAASQKMEEARAIRALADRANEQAREERLQIDRDRQLHIDQLALLQRALDEDSGPDLRLAQHPAGDVGFVMNERKMTSRERLVYGQPWQSMIANIARRFARFLEKARGAAARLLDRELAVERQEAELAEAKAAAARAIASERETQMKEHEAALAVLDEREALVDARRADAERLADEARTLFDQAEALGEAVIEDVANSARWNRALEQIAERPSVITVDAEGKAAFVPAIAEQLGDEFLDTIASMASADAKVPDWAFVALERELEMAEKRHAVLKKADPIMNPAQELVAREARSVMRNVAAVYQRGQGV
ncbi:hypothetical protein GCM10023219_00060 [Stakelama sediminis]|uniref:Uncharacterized protein n=1 Tax=Stakelama sediminis TaxID=463200 RepID=A0A840Z1A2_9SPHN|nr:hypothetical protein [Stakelama sediminis]MBB5719557.1 hypothetical protein [Stakelama sediminis]